MAHPRAYSSRLVAVSVLFLTDVMFCTLRIGRCFSAQYRSVT